jgi:hypothetical protein
MTPALTQAYDTWQMLAVRACGCKLAERKARSVVQHLNAFGWLARVWHIPSNCDALEAVFCALHQADCSCQSAEAGAAQEGLTKRPISCRVKQVCPGLTAAAPAVHVRGKACWMLHTISHLNAITEDQYKPTHSSPDPRATAQLHSNLTAKMTAHRRPTKTAQQAVHPRQPQAKLPCPRKPHHTPTYTHH